MKKLKDGKYLTLLGIYIGLFLAGVFGALLFYGPAKQEARQISAQPAPHVSQTIERNVENGKGAVFTVLLLGHGGAGHSGGALADAIQLLFVAPTSKKATLISIPRDAWVSTPTGEAKINKAFTVGQTVNERAESTKMAAAQVTGLPVDYFVSIDFSGFERLVDQLGGITVNVPRSFVDHFYPVRGKENDTCGLSIDEIAQLHETHTGFELEKQFTCRYESLKHEKGPTAMDGEAALKFVRSRHSPEHGGDFARGVRQQAVLLAIGEKLLSLRALSRVDQLYEEAAKIVNTDLSLPAAQELVNILGEPSDYDIQTISLGENVFNLATSGDGQSILVPAAGPGRFGAIHEHIQKRIN